ncbi:MAG: hypothetical protein II652_03505 [Bacteroidales bacterium]|nr:hypothetical protein [Bacteroidales bacterium]
MKNEVFSFKRFWTYFKYDLVQLYRRHAKAALLFAGSGLILYVAWIAGSLVFDHCWSAPSIGARVVVAMLSAAALEFYYAYLYGFVTDRRKGSSYLMIPASKTEKFVSILLNALIVVPVAFIAVQLGVDALLCLLDPTMEGTMAGGGYDVVAGLMERLADEEDLLLLRSSMSTAFILSLLSFAFNYLYFLLCGMCFRKSKIVGAVAIVIGVTFVLSLCSGLFIGPLTEWAMNFDFDDVYEAQAFARGLLRGMTIVEGFMVLGIGWGIFHRLKTLKH